MEKIRYITTLSLLLIYTLTLGQSPIVLNAVVPMEGYSANVLMQNADAYFTKVPERIKNKKKKKSYLDGIVREENSIAIPKEAMVYSRSVAKHPLGKIYFVYKVEVKEDKYRYSLNFVEYTPFERDRYGKFVPVPGKKFSIEEITNNQKFRYRKDILAFVNEYVEAQSSRLYSNMLEFPTAENETADPGDDW